MIRNHIARDFLDVCKRLYSKGFVAASDGNVSVRMDNGKVLCTPTGRNKGDLKADDLVLIDMEGKVLDGTSQPSTEIQMHLLYYKQRPDVRAVVHAHPPYCTGFATTGEGLTGCVLPEIVVSLGTIPLAPYATPSTAEVPESILPFVNKHDVIMLRNHGVVASGSTVLSAYYALEKTEHAANILFIARALGGETRLTESQVRQLKEISSGSYGIDALSKPSCETANSADNARFSSASQSSLELKEHIRRAIKDLRL
jgi:L-fuculose-phosphate aldolase